MKLRTTISIAITLAALAGASASAQAHDCCDDIYVQSGPSSDFVLGMTVGAFAGYALGDGHDRYDNDRRYRDRHDAWRWHHHWRHDHPPRWYSYEPPHGRPYWHDDRRDHRDEGRHGGHDSWSHHDDRGHSGGWVDHYNHR